jgi:hypothetical protein
MNKTTVLTVTILAVTTGTLFIFTPVLIQIQAALAQQQPNGNSFQI